jgi:hypothetical protein
VTPLLRLSRSPWGASAWPPGGWTGKASDLS